MLYVLRRFGVHERPPDQRTDGMFLGVVMADEAVVMAAGDEESCADHLVLVATASLATQDGLLELLARLPPDETIDLVRTPPRRTRMVLPLHNTRP